MRAFIVFLLFIILFVAATAIGIPFFVSADSLRGQVAALVKQKTGRDLTIDGKTSFFMFPRIGLKATRVSLSNPPYMADGKFVTMQEMRVSLKFLPLLTGRIDLAEFVLVKPEIHLLVNKGRQNNWTFSPTVPKAGDSGSAAKPADKPAGETAAGGTGLPRDLRLGRIALIDGRFTYRDELTGARYAANQINLEFAAPSLAEPLSARGSAVWNGQKVGVDMQLKAPGAFVEGKLSGLELSISAPSLKAGFVGTAARVSGILLEGSVKADSLSLRDLSAWTGSPLGAGRGLGAFKVSSSLNYSDDILTLSDAAITLDAMTARGTASIDLADKRPSIEAALNLDELNLNTYLAGGERAAASGGKARAGWSDAPIDFSGLRGLDAALKLSAGRIIYGKTTIGKSKLGVLIKGGRLKATLSELAVYGGSAKGVLLLDGAKAVPALATRFTVQNVNSFPLLKTALNFDWIEGNANLSLDLKARGASQKQMMSALGGTGKILFNNGAIRGINIAQMLRGLGSATLTGWNRAPTRKTDFSSLSGTFTVTNGIATNNDLSMIGPLVRLSGAGTVDLPRQRLNYRLTPKLVASIKGQGGATDLAGLKIPIVISGQWSNPKIYPDIKGILDNPAAAYNSLRQIGSQIKKGDVNSVINSLIGSGTTEPGAAAAEPVPEETKKSSPLKALEEQIRKDPTKTFKKLF